jgi:hypothetical protein
MTSKDTTVDPDIFYSDWYSDSESDDDEIKRVDICYIVMTMICHCVDYINNE